MVHFIGCASGTGAGDNGCQMGPFAIQEHLPFEVDWKAILTPDTTIINKRDQVADLSRKLAQETYTNAMNHPFTVVIGGDHSCGIGTWSGIASALATKGQELGIIWIDAHKDSHTLETSDSGNIHGMPLAALMGYGSPLFTQVHTPSPKVQPRDVFLVGIRSYEEAETKLLESLNVRVYYIDEVKRRGQKAIFSEIIAHFQNRKIAYGISMDIDAFDPKVMSATGTPVDDGLCPQEFIDNYKIIEAYPPVAFEFAEFNPAHDTQNQSMQWTTAILKRVTALFRKEEAIV